MVKSKTPAWAWLLIGAAVSLILYVLLQGLLALLTIRGVAPETMTHRLQMGSGAIAAFTGGILAIRRAGIGSLWAAAGSAAIFAGAVALLGYLICNGVVWSQESMLLMTAFLTGGVLAGLLGREGKKKRKTGRREKVGRRPL